MRELKHAELDHVSGGSKTTQVPLAGSNPNRQNGFFTGASLTAFFGGLQTASDNIINNSPNPAVSSDGETKPPSR